MVSTRRLRVRHRRSVPSASQTPSCLASPRNRSSSSACSTGTNSSNSGSSSSSLSACAQLSPSFRCLEKISIDVAVDEEKSLSHPSKTQAVFYVLRVHHAACDVAWSYRRDLNEYQSFQRQLLQILKQGHVCPGDCPWLYSFLKSYFPKGSSCPFKLFCPKMIAKRREALIHCFTTMHGFLLTRENQSCNVLRSSVLKAFIAFVYGELGLSHPLLSKMKVSEQLAASAAATADDSESAESSPAGGSGCSSLTASTNNSVSSDTASPPSSSNSAVVAVPACPLCRNRLDEDATSFSDPIHPLPPLAPSASTTSSSSNRRASSVRSYYATTLRCGHEFHEECILQWLNQALNCPVCGQSEVVSPRSERRESHATSSSSNGSASACSTTGS